MFLPWQNSEWAIRAWARFSRGRRGGGRGRYYFFDLYRFYIKNMFECACLQAYEQAS